MAINMFCGEVKTFLETANMDGNALEEVMKMGFYYFLLKGCFYYVIAIEE